MFSSISSWFDGKGHSQSKKNQQQQSTGQQFPASSGKGNAPGQSNPLSNHRPQNPIPPAGASIAAGGDRNGVNPTTLIVSRLLTDGSPPQLPIPTGGVGGGAGGRAMVDPLTLGSQASTTNKRDPWQFYFMDDSDVDSYMNGVTNAIDISQDLEVLLNAAKQQVYMDCNDALVAHYPHLLLGGTCNPSLQDLAGLLAQTLVAIGGDVGLLHALSTVCLTRAKRIEGMIPPSTNPLQNARKFYVPPPAPPLQPPGGPGMGAGQTVFPVQQYQQQQQQQYQQQQLYPSTQGTTALPHLDDTFHQQPTTNYHDDRNVHHRTLQPRRTALSTAREAISATVKSPLTSGLFTPPNEEDETAEDIMPDENITGGGELHPPSTIRQSSVPDAAAPQISLGQVKPYQQQQQQQQHQQQQYVSQTPQGRERSVSVVSSDVAGAAPPTPLASAPIHSGSGAGGGGGAHPFSFSNHKPSLAHHPHHGGYTSYDQHAIKKLTQYYKHHKQPYPHHHQQQQYQHHQQALSHAPPHGISSQYALSQAPHQQTQPVMAMEQQQPPAPHNCTRCGAVILASQYIGVNTPQPIRHFCPHSTVFLPGLGDNQDILEGIGRHFQVPRPLTIKKDGSTIILSPLSAFVHHNMHVLNEYAVKYGIQPFVRKQNCDTLVYMMENNLLLGCQNLQDDMNIMAYITRNLGVLREYMQNPSMKSCDTLLDISTGSAAGTPVTRARLQSPLDQQQQQQQQGVLSSPTASASTGIEYKRSSASATPQPIPEVSRSPKDTDILLTKDQHKAMVECRNQHLIPITNTSAAVTSPAAAAALAATVSGGAGAGGSGAQPPVPTYHFIRVNNLIDTRPALRNGSFVSISYNHTHFHSKLRLSEDNLYIYWLVDTATQSAELRKPQASPLPTPVISTFRASSIAVLLDAVNGNGSSNDPSSQQQPQSHTLGQELNQDLLSLVEPRHNHTYTVLPDDVDGASVPLGDNLSSLVPTITGPPGIAAGAPAPRIVSPSGLSRTRSRSKSMGNTSMAEDRPRTTIRQHQLSDIQQSFQPIYTIYKYTGGDMLPLPTFQRPLDENHLITSDYLTYSTATHDSQYSIQSLNHVVCGVPLPVLNAVPNIATTTANSSGYDLMPNNYHNQSSSQLPGQQYVLPSIGYGLDHTLQTPMSALASLPTPMVQFPPDQYGYQSPPSAQLLQSGDVYSGGEDPHATNDLASPVLSLSRSTASRRSGVSNQNQYNNNTGGGSRPTLSKTVSSTSPSPVASTVTSRSTSRNGGGGAAAVVNHMSPSSTSPTAAEAAAVPDYYYTMDPKQGDIHRKSILATTTTAGPTGYPMQQNATIPSTVDDFTPLVQLYSQPSFQRVIPLHDMFHYKHHHHHHHHHHQLSSSKPLQQQQQQQQQQAPNQPPLPYTNALVLTKQRVHRLYASFYDVPVRPDHDVMQYVHTHYPTIPDGYYKTQLEQLRKEREASLALVQQQQQGDDVSDSDDTSSNDDGDSDTSSVSSDIPSPHLSFLSLNPADLLPADTEHTGGLSPQSIAVDSIDSSEIQQQHQQQQQQQVPGTSLGKPAIVLPTTTQSHPTHQAVAVAGENSVATVTSTTITVPAATTPGLGPIATNSSSAQLSSSTYISERYLEPHHQPIDMSVNVALYTQLSQQKTRNMHVGNRVQPYVASIPPSTRGIPVEAIVALDEYTTTSKHCSCANGANVATLSQSLKAALCRGGDFRPKSILRKYDRWKRRQQQQQQQQQPQYQHTPSRAPRRGRRKSSVFYQPSYASTAASSIPDNNIDLLSVITDTDYFSDRQQEAGGSGRMAKGSISKPATGGALATAAAGGTAASLATKQKKRCGCVATHLYCVKVVYELPQRVPITNSPEEYWKALTKIDADNRVALQHLSDAYAWGAHTPCPPFPYLKVYRKQVIFQFTDRNEQLMWMYSIKQLKEMFIDSGEHMVEATKRIEVTMPLYLRDQDVVSNSTQQPYGSGSGQQSSIDAINRAKYKSLVPPGVKDQDDVGSVQRQVMQAQTDPLQLLVDASTHMSIRKKINADRLELVNAIQHQQHTYREEEKGARLEDMKHLERQEMALQHQIKTLQDHLQVQEQHHRGQQHKQQEAVHQQLDPSSVMYGHSQGAYADHTHLQTNIRGGGGRGDDGHIIPSTAPTDGTPMMRGHQGITAGGLHPSLSSIDDDMPLDLMGASLPVSSALHGEIMMSDAGTDLSTTISGGGGDGGVVSSDLDTASPQSTLHQLRQRLYEVKRELSGHIDRYVQDYQVQPPGLLTSLRRVNSGHGQQQTSASIAGGGMPGNQIPGDATVSTTITGGGISSGATQFAQPMDIAASSTPTLRPMGSQVGSGGASTVVSPQMPSPQAQSPTPAIVGSLHTAQSLLPTQPPIPLRAISRIQLSTVRKSRILTSSAIEHLISQCGRKATFTKWSMVYSLLVDGADIQTLFNSIKNCGHTIILLRNNHGEIMGGYSGTRWKANEGYHGNHESFVYRMMVPEAYRGGDFTPYYQGSSSFPDDSNTNPASASASTSTSVVPGSMHSTASYTSSLQQLSTPMSYQSSMLLNTSTLGGGLGDSTGSSSNTPSTSTSTLSGRSSATDGLQPTQPATTDGVENPLVNMTFVNPKSSVNPVDAIPLIYPWRGPKPFYLVSNPTGFGWGVNALYIYGAFGSQLNLGQSQYCDSFQNPPLSAHGGEFKVYELEIYGAR